MDKDVFRYWVYGQSVFIGEESKASYPAVVSTRTETPERETSRKLGSTG